MIRFEENPTWIPTQESKLASSLEAASAEVVVLLKNELSAHQTSGNDWRDVYPNMRFISSDPEKYEYPQFQSGSLQSDTKHQVFEDPLSVGIGFFGEDTEKYLSLEFFRIQTFEGAGNAERKMVVPQDYGPLYMTFQGRNSFQVLSVMRQVLEKNMRSR